MKTRKFVTVKIEGRQGKNSIWFERVMDFNSASKVLITAMQQMGRKPYTKK